MDIKYMMLKKRYIFEYKEKIFLYDVKNIDTIQKEILLFNKELALYNISLKSLSAEAPTPNIKNELLNIAAICTENQKFSQKIKLNRILPFKELSSLTKHNQQYFEKWNNYLLTYYLIFSNKYTNLFCYLNIKKFDDFTENNDKITENSNVYARSNSGLVLKATGNTCYVLTSYGDFLKLVIPNEAPIGSIVSGNIINDKNYIALLIKTIIILTIISSITVYMVFNIPKRTILIKSSFSLKIELNRFDKVIDTIPTNSKGNKIITLSKLNNKSIDVALLTIFQKAKEVNYIKDNSAVSIYISNNKNMPLNLENTTKYLKDNKIKISINDDGKE